MKKCKKIQKNKNPAKKQEKKLPELNQNAKSPTYESLTPKRQKLVDEYLKDFVEYKAYQRAGYKSTGPTGHVMACRLFAIKEVKEAVRERMKERNENARVSNEDILNAVDAIAMFRISKLFINDNGKWRMRKVWELDEATDLAIAGLDGVRIDDKTGEIKVKNIKLWNKGKFMDLSLQHRGLLGKDIKGLKDKKPSVLYMPQPMSTMEEWEKFIGATQGTC